MITMTESKNEHFRECQGNLEKWSNSRWALVKYFENEESIDLEDITFLKIFGTSVIRMDRFSSCIIKWLEKQNRLEKSETDKMINFVTFHNNLLVSKAKHFFYKELPNQHEGDCFLKPEVGIYYLGRDLISYLTKLEKKRSNVKKLLFKYYFMLPMMYDVIYDLSERKALFLHFGYNKKTLKSTREYVEMALEKVTDKFSLRNFSVFLAPTIFLSHIKNLDSSFNLSGIALKDLYSDLFKQFKEKDILIEPFSWHLANVLWKTDGLIQDKKLYESRFQTFLQNFKKYVRQYFETVDTLFYQKRSNNTWLKLFEIESDFIDLLYKDQNGSNSAFYQTPEYEQLNGVLEKINHLPIKVNRGKPVKKSLNKIDKALKRVLKTVSSQNVENSLKLERLFEELEYDDLNTVFSCYSLLVSDHDFLSIVGFYSSGAFLSHILNIYQDKADRKVWLYKIYPHVSINPTHKHSKRRILDHILVCDETIKTAFSAHTFINSLYRRNIYYKNIFLNGLFDFKYYKKIDESNHLKYKTLFGIKENKNINVSELCYDIIKEKGGINVLNIWDTLFEKGKNPSEEIKKIFENNNNRFDYIHLLSSTPFVAYLANEWANKIENKYKNNTIFLYSPSAEGRVLALFVGYFLKQKSKDVVFTRDKLKLQKYDNLTKIAIDLSYHSGWTLDYNFSNFLEQPLKNNQKNEFKELFTLEGFLSEQW